MADVAQPTGGGAHGAHGADTSRRDFLTLTAAALGGIGAASALWPFIDSMNPAKDVLALSSTDVDISPVQVGQRLTVKWRGKPVFIRNRTPDEIEAAKQVPLADLRDTNARNENLPSGAPEPRRTRSRPRTGASRLLSMWHSPFVDALRLQARHRAYPPPV